MEIRILREVMIMSFTWLACKRTSLVNKTKPMLRLKEKVMTHKIGNQMVTNQALFTI